MTEEAVRGKVIGSLLGLAVCDAVGTAVEFMPPGSFPPVTGMGGGGKFSLLPGEVHTLCRLPPCCMQNEHCSLHPLQWTDDTSMALCLAESLIECQGFNPVDQAKRYWRWYQEGHLSSNGTCFDIGKTVRKALHQFERSGEPYSGSTAENAAGNGSLMRLCPVPLLYRRHPLVAMELSKDSSRVTHGPKAALDACKYFAGLLTGCLQGVTKEELLSPRYSPAPGYWEQNPMAPEVDAVACGSFKKLDPPDIKATGYVVRSLEAVLWAFHHTSNFKDGCLKVVNLGDDADTVGAIYGQLAGAYYGVEALPEEWRKCCSFSALIELFADELYQLAKSISIPDSTDWSKVNTPVSHEKLSQAYQNIKLKGYDLLEEKNKDIVRRLNPCPKQYKTLETFDADVRSLVTEYKALPAVAQNEEILGSFERMWESGREKLALRLGRSMK